LNTKTALPKKASSPKSEKQNKIDPKTKKAKNTPKSFFASPCAEFNTSRKDQEWVDSVI
jgi:hypothetical protein